MAFRSPGMPTNLRRLHDGGQIVGNWQEIDSTQLLRE